MENDKIPQQSEEMARQGATTKPEGRVAGAVTTEAPLLYISWEHQITLQQVSHSHWFFILKHKICTGTWEEINEEKTIFEIHKLPENPGI